MFVNVPNHSEISDVFLIFLIASFGFGQEIGAIVSWANGGQLEMVKANDERSKLIALVYFLYFPRCVTQVF